MRVEITEIRTKIIEIDDDCDVENAVLEKYNSFTDKDFSPLNTNMIFKILPKTLAELGVKYDINNIAKYIIKYSYENYKAVSNMQLSIILYKLYEFYLYKKNSELFVNDFISSAVYPKSKSIFYTYCGYGAMSIIPNSCDNYDFEIDEVDEKVINEFIKKYYSIKIYELDNALSGTLWQQMINNNVINEDIKFKAS